MFPRELFISLGTSLLAAVSASPTPPDIRDIVAPQPYQLAGSWWLLLVAAACLGVAGLVGWLFFTNLRSPKMQVVPSAHQTAEQRLAELRARLDKTDTRVFGGEVADILRAFIGAQYKLHAQRQTSPEFLESIRGWPYFSAIQHRLLEEFLTECDLLKFARQDATRDGKLRLIDQAAQFLAAEPPTLPVGTPGVPAPGSRSSAGAPPATALPPPMPGTLPGFEVPDARYMPPALRQTTLPPAAEAAPVATEP